MKKLFVSFSLVCASLAFFSPGTNIQAMKILEKTDTKQSDTQFFINIEEACKRENKFDFWTKHLKNAVQANRFDLIANVFQNPKSLKFFSTIYCGSSFPEKTKLGEILEPAIASLKSSEKNAPHLLKIIEAILTDNGIMRFVIAYTKSNDKAMLQQLFVLFAKHEYTEAIQKLLENELFFKLVEIKHLKKAQKYYPDDNEPPSMAKAKVADLLVQAIKKKETRCKQK
ncbi:MAG: hypothetical protein ABH827_05285 [bacterium]